VLVVALLVNILPPAAEELLIEEGLNFFILFGVSVADMLLVLGNLAGSAWAPLLIALFFVVVAMVLAWLPTIIGRSRKQARKAAALATARLAAQPSADVDPAAASQERLRKALALLYDDFGDFRGDSFMSERGVSRSSAGSFASERAGSGSVAPGSPISVEDPSGSGGLPTQ